MSAVRGEGDLSSVNILRTKGVFQVRKSAIFWCEKFGFFEIYGVFARTRRRGLSQPGHFADDG